MIQGCSWFRKGGKAEDRVLETPADYKPTPEGPRTPGGEVRPPSAPPESPRPVGLRAAEPLLVIYFDFDQADIRTDQLERVDQNLKYLLDTPEAKVLIEGHCDDRGSTEYNFALGERRARAISDYFMRNGVSAGRIQILSKGEEEPAVRGSDDSSWSKNRRCEFKFFD